MAAAPQTLQQSDREKTLDELRPPNHDYSHQDSLFGNAFSSKAYFIVHPEWLSENVNPPVSQPLERKPWPWEIPKYRQNIRAEMQKIINGNSEKSTPTPPSNSAPAQTVPDYQTQNINLPIPYGKYNN